jgi:hypothetical protein
MYDYTDVIYINGKEKVKIKWQLRDFRSAGLK